MITKARNSKARRTLAELGCRQPFGVRFGPYLYLTVVIGLAATAWIADEIGLTVLSLSQLAAPIITLGAIGLAVHQWRHLRNEATIIGGVARRDLTNEYFRKLQHHSIISYYYADAAIPWAISLMDKDQWSRQMYVFVELDNLQDGLEKYRLGYSSAYQALRVVDLFAARCQSTRFVDCVMELTEPGAGSYTPEVISVSRNLIPGKRYL